MTPKNTFRTPQPSPWNSWMYVALFQSHDNIALETMHVYHRFDLCFTDDLRKIL